MKQIKGLTTHRQLELKKPQVEPWWAQLQISIRHQPTDVSFKSEL